MIYFFYWDIKLLFAIDTLQISLEQLMKSEKLMSRSTERMICLSGKLK